MKTPAEDAGLGLTLVHVDHRIDPASGARADRSEALARQLALPWRRIAIDVPSQRARRESPEAAARRLRYGALESVRAELGATRIATGHHRDDQLETIVLQLLRGAPLERLGGMPRHRGAIVRPLLDLPRATLLQLVAEAALEPIEDPTNLDLRVPRNRVRHRLLPRLRSADPGIDEALLALAVRSTALRKRMEILFRSNYEKPFIEGKDEEKAKGRGPTPVFSKDEWQGGDLGTSRAGVTVSTSFLTSLPAELQASALRWLLERLGTDRLSSFPSMKAFLSLLSFGSAAAAELRLPGGGRLVARRGRLEWRTRESRTPQFSYTLEMPGEVELPELGLRLRIRRAPVEPWMFRGDQRRVGFEAGADRAIVRTRRPGDRMRPLGAPGSRKLKAILIDRQIPAEVRDRLPLLVIEGELAWAPGVALGDRFALREGHEGWLAELETLEEGASPAPPGERKAS